MLGTWVKRSLRYYGARHLAFAGTVALTAAILSAALLTGESLQQGLRQGLAQRLGPVRTAVTLSEGVFPASLARRLPDTQAALLLRGDLLDGAGAVCADRVQVIGVAEAAAPAGAGDAEGGALARAGLNERGRGVQPDAAGAVRFEKPALYSVEMPLGAARESRLVRRAVRFDGAPPQAGLLTPDFALRAASVPPVNVFVPHAALSEAAGVPGMANLLVSSREPAEFARALQDALTPEEAGLVLEPAEGADATLVTSRRVYLPSGVGAALAAGGLKAEWATFHLADAFEAQGRATPDGVATNEGAVRATPYGFVVAVTPGGAAGVPDDLKDDEVVISAWLAETLGVSAPAAVTLRWRRFESGGRLIAESRVFRVRGVIPTETAALAKRAMPVFPGLAGVDSCAAWDVGLPMDEEKLKDAANEAYWKQWRETPKAFLTLAAGQACFGTAFGGAMSARVAADEATVRAALKTLSPLQLGFAARPVWEEGVAVAQGSSDFKGLFAGMAFVLVVAALLLSALSLALALETRKGEMALFSALGWSSGRMVAAVAAEWCVPLIAGAAAGGGLGAGLARALVWSLGRFWGEAFAGARMAFHFSPAAACAASGVSLMLTGAVLVGTVRRYARCRPVELWQAAGGAGPDVLKAGGSLAGELGASLAGGVLAVAAGAVMVLSPEGAAANGAFFGAGFLLLVSLLLFMKSLAAVWLRRAHGPDGAAAADAPARVLSAVTAGVSRAVRSPRRSAPVVVLLAAGIFLTVGILSMKQDPAAGCERPWSGSGGFASIVYSVAPLERARGLELARRASGAKGAVPLRVREGDEAGCLNMNQPQTPRVIGVDARTMARARAFEPEDSGGIWSLLEETLKDGTIPALAADRTMLQYSLKARAGRADGTVFDYPGADGAAVRLRVVGALPVRSGILQGALIVDEQRFAQAFPEASGYRMWLCDYAPYVLREAAEERRGARGHSLSGAAAVAKLRHPEPGATVETVQERLRLLGSVESAYLDMFLVLGGLGVVLGVAGVALVILRGVAERRGELALLNAVGLPRRTVAGLLAAEYGVMVLAGLAAGLVPALVAIQPAVRSLKGALPWGAMVGVVAGLLVSAGLCVFLAAHAAARRYGPGVLKEEV